MKVKSSSETATSPSSGRRTDEMPLDAAVDVAIEKGKRAAAELQERVGEVVEKLRATRDPLRPWAAWTSPSGERQTTSAAAERFIALIDGKDREIASAFSRQRKSLETFNIVFFGRTGAGKSSLIEALSSGDGSSVSMGESDWTTEVVSTPWKACFLVDTPGINGWGRSRSRADLEERARQATEGADVVILCFDSQSQQESEFAKVAEWIQRYRKPAIAVLNGRNPRWRMPTLVRVASARRTISQHIQQNASNIRDELAKIGLSSIPIVALSSKRALFARAKEPFQGPDAATLAKHRHEYGCENLLDWSNLRALEALLVDSLRSDAAALRTGMLRDKVKGTLQALDSDLAVLDSEAKKALDLVQTAVGSVLAIVGYPTQAERKVLTGLRDDRAEGDLLTHLETVRGARFESPRAGEFGTHLKHLLSSRFAPLRSDALNKADRVIAEAFDERTELDGEQFNARVLPIPTMNDAAQAVLKDCVQFLERKINLVSRDADVDLRCLAGQGAGISGQAGQSYRWASYASKTAGILTGVASTLGTLAVTNMWNPLGWGAGVAAAVAGIGGLLSALFGWGGKKAQRKAEERRLEARRGALADARKHVNGTFDRFIDEVDEQASRYARETMALRLAAPLREAICLVLLSRELAAARKEIAAAIQGIGHHHNPMRIFERAAGRVEAGLLPDDPAAARKLWLGESWVDDPCGLDAATGNSKAQRTRAYDPSAWESAVEQIRSALAKFVEKPKPGFGRGWLKHLRAAAEGDAAAATILTELEAIAALGKSRVHLHGDYNAGKTSFIKRLLIDAGQPVPEGLTVRADPTTAAVASHDWIGMELVDSPGFQSGRDEDTAAAIRASPDASFILYLFQPNLVTGSVEALRTVLEGDESTGFVSKLGRTFLVINRADELGVDPDDDGAGFRHLCGRKRDELAQAMASQGLAVPAERIFCMASDPYGLVGDRRDVNSSHFDPFRGWDGFRPFVEAFRRVRSELMRSGTDISLLEGGAARLSRLRASIAAGLEKRQRERDCLGRIQVALDDAIGEADRIAGHVEGQCAKLIDEHAFGLLADTFEAVDESELEALSKKLARWWTDQAFCADVEHWHKDSRKTIDEWAERVQDELGRRLASAEFTTTFPDLKERFDAESLSPKKKSTAGKVLEVLEKPLRFGGNRDVVYEVGKFFGAKFRPWGAVKTAGYLGKANAVLAAGGVVLDVADLILSVRREKKRDIARANARKFVLDTAQKFRQAILKGSGGPIAYIQANRSEMRKHRDLLHTEIVGLDEASAAERRRLAKYLLLLNSAREHLGLSPIREQDVEKETGRVA